MQHSLTTKSSLCSCVCLNYEIFQPRSCHFREGETLPGILLMIFFFPLFAFITDSPTNKRLLSGRFASMIQGRNLWMVLSTSPAAYSRYCLSAHSGRTGGRDKDKKEAREEEVGARKHRHKQRREQPRRSEEWDRGGNRSIVSRRRRGGMNIPILPCSLETAASSFGGQRCLCLFPAWLFAWCIPQLYIQWWEKDDVLAGWQWSRRGTEVEAVSLIQRKDQGPRSFTPN